MSREWIIALCAAFFVLGLYAGAALAVWAYEAPSPLEERLEKVIAPLSSAWRVA